MGALTSKTYSFKMRSWELESVDGFDFFSPFFFPVKFDINNGQIQRVLPRLNGWIDDRIRFSYDGFRNQRFTKPIFSSSGGGKEELRETNWKNIFEKVLYYNNFFSTVCFGPFSNFNSVFLSTRLVQELPPSTIDLSVYGRRNSTNCKIFDENPGTVYFLVGVDLQNFPMLSYKFRCTSSIILAFGCYSINFKHYNLGISVVTLLNFVEGRHPLCQIFSSSQRIEIYLGSGVTRRLDLDGFFSMVSSIPNANFFFLPSSVGESSSLEFGVSYYNMNQPAFAESVLSLDGSELYSNSSKIRRILLQHHGVDSSHSVGNALIFPISAPYEYRWWSVNFSGDYVEVPSILPKDNLPSSTELLNFFFEIFNIKAPPQILESRFGQKLPASKKNYLGKKRIWLSTLTPVISTFYLDNQICRSSSNMGIAFRRFKLKL